MTLGALLDTITEQLASVGIASPRVDAEWLLAHVLCCARVDLHLRGQELLNAATVERTHVLVQRRLAREPLQYILGTQSFWGREFVVNPSVLIPRPETEELVAWMIETLSAAAQHILDVGTGSGCIGITLACERAHDRIVLLDQSAAALQVAQENISRHGVAERVQCVAGDLWSADDGVFDVIVSNPPYCDPRDWSALQPEVRDFEPQNAIVAEAAGLAVLQRIIAESPQYLRAGGLIFLECGQGQDEQIVALLHATGAYSAIEVRCDVHGVRRMCRAMMRS